MVAVETDDDGRRWAEAEALAQGIDDPDRLRVRRNRAFLVIAAIVVTSWVVGVLVALIALVAPHGTAVSGIASEQDVSTDTRFVVALVVEGIGFVTVVVGFIWAWRTGRYILRWRSIASPLTARQRKRAQRTIAGKTALDPPRIRYLLALAAQNRRSIEGMTPIYGGIVLIDSVDLLLHPTPYSLAVTVVVTVLFGWVAVQLTLLYRRSGRYIAAHGQGGTAAG